MLKELVDRFIEHDNVNGALYKEGFRTSVDFTFKSDMRMEISGMTNLPPYLLFTQDGLYLDPSMEEPLPAEIVKEYDSFRLYDPRVIVNGIVSLLELLSVFFITSDSVTFFPSSHHSLFPSEHSNAGPSSR